MASPERQEKADPPPKDHVIVGSILGASGLRGEVRVRGFTDSRERYATGSTVYFGSIPRRIERSRPHKSGLVVKFEGVDGRNAAEALRGTVLTVPLSAVLPLEGSNYYHYQIIGMAVWTAEDEYLGTVREILPAGGTDVYVIKSEEGRELLLPALREVVTDVDITANRMTVSVPEGLR